MHQVCAAVHPISQTVKKSGQVEVFIGEARLRIKTPLAQNETEPVISRYTLYLLITATTAINTNIQASI